MITRRTVLIALAVAACGGGDDDADDGAAGGPHAGGGHTGGTTGDGGAGGSGAASRARDTSVALICCTINTDAGPAMSSVTITAATATSITQPRWVERGVS